jgi:glutathione-independent formaldehyde dehydrogenase
LPKISFFFFFNKQKKKPKIKFTNHQVFCFFPKKICLIMPYQKGQGSNHGVVYKGPHDVSVESIPYPSLSITRHGQKCDLHHGAIIKVVTTAICGSDLHMYNGRTSIKPGFVFGHEVTGEVLQVGDAVENIKVGDLVSVPFSIACGTCLNCKEGLTSGCLSSFVNPLKQGGTYGYVSRGDWQGGQSEFLLTPYADFNLLKFPNKDRAMEKILDLTMLTDVLPTGYHGAVSANVGSGSTVYVAGAGPVGLACARSCFFLGAAVVIVGDMNRDRLALAKSFGCHIVDLNKEESIQEQINKILGEPYVDAAIDCVGFEASGCCENIKKPFPAEVLNHMMEVTRVGGAVGIPGVYLPEDPGAPEEHARHGKLELNWAKGWCKGLTFVTGQCPVMKYNEKLMKAILWDRLDIAKCLNTTVLPLNEAPKAYRDFVKGAPNKFILDPQGILAQHATH